MTTLYCAILVAGFMATASLADIDPQRMQRDIRIMEGILSNQNLYYDVPDGANFRARGLYFDGYGVLFVAAGPSPGVERWDKSLSQEELLAAIRDLLTEFLGDYAGTIGQLDKDDRITVCYRPHSSGIEHMVSVITRKRKQLEDDMVSVITRERKQLEDEVKAVAVVARDSLLADVEEADKPSHRPIVARVHGLTPHHHRAADAAPLIVATAKKSAIDAFRDGRIDSATFRQRIAFAEHSASKKIDIMAGILDQVSGHDQHPFVGTQRTLGMYQPDLGALFFINESVPFFNSLSLDDVKANIVEAVADYGATLRQVQSDEHVIVEYRSPPSARSALLKVPKSAIDAYARGDLDLDAFRKKAVWETQ